VSYDGLEDKDLPLKLRFMSLLWNIGWYVRPNVKVFRYQEGRRTKDQFTDIDVLAVKFLPMQDQIVAVSSAKSGKESDPAELYWLAGVKSYFGASLAYYIRPQANLLKTKAICDKLGIIALNEEQLGLLEQRFSVRIEDSEFFCMDSYRKISKFFEELKELRPSLYNYITEKFWTDPMNNQLLRVITGTRDLSKLNLSNECKLFMKYYFASLLALPLYRLTHQLVRVPGNMVESELATALMGGELARGEKERIIEACKSFVYEFAESVKLPQASNASIDSMFRQVSQLEYFKDILDLLTKMVLNYKYSVYVPRMLDALSFHLVKKPGLVPDIRFVTLPDIHKDEWEQTAMLTKDILIFSQRVGGLEKTEMRL
jgi:hypothetical protein